MKKLLSIGVLLFILSQSIAVRGEIECIEQLHGKEPLCLDLGGNKKPARPIVIKPGKGCGASSACGGNMKVDPSISKVATKTPPPTTIELAPQLKGKPGATPSLPGTLRDQPAQH